MTPVESRWLILGLVAGSVVFWLLYIESKDRLRTGPAYHLIGAFTLGAGAAVLALGVFICMEVWGGLDLQPTDRKGLALLCFAFIGPVEEGAKVLFAWLIVFKWREFAEPIDGFVHAAALSLGFASLENLLHLPGLPLTEQIARTLTLPITHTLFAALWGFGIAHARLRMTPGPASWALQVGCIAAAALLHGLYDFLLMGWQATFITSSMVLVMWIFVIVRARKLVRAKHTRTQEAQALTGKFAPVRA